MPRGDLQVVGVGGIDVKRAFDPVKLTRHWWDGPEPVPGDALRTRTGRTYLIQRVVGRILHCVVLPKSDSSVPGRVFEWIWSSRNRRLAP